jgi:hypothetical protein
MFQARVRYGYRKIRVSCEGWDVGKYLVYRLYKEEGLVVYCLSGCFSKPQGVV